MSDKPTTYQLPDGTRTNLLPGCTDCQGRADVLGINLKQPTAVEAVAASIDPDAFDPDVKRSTRGASLIQWMTRKMMATRAATRALAFIRDAIHRDGDDADAIRQALGLRWLERPLGVPTHDFKPVRRVVGDWQEVPDDAV